MLLHSSGEAGAPATPQGSSHDANTGNPVFARNTAALAQAIPQNPGNPVFGHPAAAPLPDGQSSGENIVKKEAESLEATNALFGKEEVGRSLSVVSEGKGESDGKDVAALNGHH